MASQNTEGLYFAPTPVVSAASVSTSDPIPLVLINGLVESGSQLRTTSLFASSTWAAPITTNYAMESHDNDSDRFALSATEQNILYAPIHKGSNPEDLALSDSELFTKRSRQRKRQNSGPENLNLFESKRSAKRRRQKNNPRRHPTSNAPELSDSALMELCYSRGLVVTKRSDFDIRLRTDSDLPTNTDFSVTTSEDFAAIMELSSNTYRAKFDPVNIAAAIPKRKTQEISSEDKKTLLLTSRRKQTADPSASLKDSIRLGEDGSSKLSDLSDLINSDVDEFQPIAPRGKQTQTAAKARRSVRFRTKVSYAPDYEDTELLD
jgi:hypothetical protein